MSNMNAINMLLLFDTSTFLPFPKGSFWIDNNFDKIITNTGAFIVFNPGP